MSSGERVLVALALAILDYSQSNPPSVCSLLGLDRGNLRRVARALERIAS